MNHIDLIRLLLKLLFVYSAGYLQTLRVICNRDESVSAIESGSRHLFDISRAVAPLRVHLKVAVQPLHARGICGKRRTCLGQRKESSSYFGRNRNFRRLCDPYPNDPFQNGADSGQFCQGAALLGEYYCFFGPKKCLPGCAP